MSSKDSSKIKKAHKTRCKSIITEAKNSIVVTFCGKDLNELQT